MMADIEFDIIDTCKDCKAYYREIREVLAGTSNRQQMEHGMKITLTPHLNASNKLMGWHIGGFTFLGLEYYINEGTHVVQVRTR